MNVNREELNLEEELKLFDKDEDVFDLGTKRSYPSVVRLQVPKTTMGEISKEYHARKRE